MNIEIANRLVELRKKNGLSQEELADKLGLSRQAVSKWERAESSPDTDNLICLAKLYNVSLDDLLDTTQSIEEISAEVKEKNEEEKQYVRQDKYAHLSEKEKKRARGFDIADHIIWASGYIICVVIYFAISFNYNEQWSKLWVIFLAPIIVSSIINTIKNRRFCNFAYPVFVALVYFIFGVYFHNWHPSWIVFVTIPLYYSIFGPIDKAIAKKRNEPIDLEDPADEDDDED